MTEMEWIACTDLWVMLEFLRGRASDRKLRLVAVNACRPIWELLTDEHSRNAVLVAERFADGLADEDDLCAARTQATDALKTVQATRSQRLSEFYDPLDAAADAALATVATAAFLPNDSRLLRPRYDCFTSAIGAAGNAVAANRLREAEASNSTTRNEDSVRLRREGGAEQIWTETRNREWALQAHLLHCVFGSLLFRPITVNPALLTPTVVQLAQAIYDDRAFDLMTELADSLQKAGCDNEEILSHCRGPGPHVRGCWVVDLLLGKK